MENTIYYVSKLNVKLKIKVIAKCQNIAASYRSFFSQKEREKSLSVKNDVFRSSPVFITLQLNGNGIRDTLGTSEMMLVVGSTQGSKQSHLLSQDARKVWRRKVSKQREIK